MQKGAVDMKKSVRLTLMGVGAAAVGMGITGVAHRAVTKYFVDVALNRQLPKHTAVAEQKLSGGGQEEKYMHILKQAGERLKAQGGETVQICGRDGTALVGHWFAHADAKRIIIAMHGWRSSWYNDFGIAAREWFSNGCSVLFVEQRGQGGSGGEYISFGLLERHDCLAWAQWVNRRCGEELPVYLCGVSMGASTVLMAAGLELPKNIRGIIADCGYSSPAAIWEHVAKDNLKLPYGSRRAMARGMSRKKLQIGIDDYSCVEAMRECEVPVLFIHGTDDRFVPIEMTYENYKACAAPKRLFVVPGAGHGMSYLVDTEGYRAAIKRFWEEFDTEDHTKI
jgi:fermentation-respiration switch protein FrsA (DUF1100 family)